MLLAPRKFKFKKIHRSSIKKLNRIKTYLTFKKHPITLITTQNCNLKSKQIEAVRKNLSRKLKNYTKFHISIFPDLPVTAKPTAMRMGKGKGNFKEWVCKIKAGTSIFRFKEYSKTIIQKRLTTKYNKFPIKIKLI